MGLFAAFRAVQVPCLLQTTLKVFNPKLCVEERHCHSVVANLFTQALKVCEPIICQVHRPLLVVGKWGTHHLRTVKGETDARGYSWRHIFRVRISHDWQSTPKQVAGRRVSIRNCVVQGQVSQKAPIYVQVLISFGSKVESWWVDSSTRSLFQQVYLRICRVLEQPQNRVRNSL